MGRPSKPGKRRFVRLPDSLWERIDALAGQYEIDYSEVVVDALRLGLEDTRLPALLNREANDRTWAAFLTLSHLDTVRRMLTDEKVEVRLFRTQGEQQNALASTDAAIRWLALEDQIKTDLDSWLLSRLWPDKPEAKEIRATIRRGEARVEKEGPRWFIVLPERLSRRLAEEVEGLVGTEILEEVEGNTRRFQIKTE